MNTNCKEILRQARLQLNGHYSLPMRAFIMTFCIATLIEWPFAKMQESSPYLRQTIILCIVEVLISLIGSLFTCGQFRIHLNMSRDKEYSLTDLFWAFRNRPDRILICSVVLLILNIIALIPVIGGYLLYKFAHYSIAIPIIGAIISVTAVVYLQLRYQLIYLVLLDHENITTHDAFKISGGLMTGNLWKFFQLYLSFVGLFFLSACSFGIGLLWVYPYFLQAIVRFYLTITRE